MHQTVCTILIVDDSPEDRSTYQAFLRQNTECIYTFLEAEEVEEGLSLFRTVDVDCILLDYQMPDSTGIEFLERLKDQVGDAMVPVIVITGRGSELVAVECLKKGACDYLIKSAVNAENLYRATRNALELGRLNNQVRQEQRERGEAEAHLRDSEKRFRLLVESVKDYAIVMLDPYGRVNSWNAGARGLLGYHDDEIVGQHFRTLFTPELQRAQAPEADLEAATAMGCATEERWYRTKDGAPLWASSVVSSIRDRLGVLCGYSVVLRDTTERRQNLLRLQEAVAARDAFLAIASHELKTPVTGVMLQIQNLRRQLGRGDDRVIDRLIPALDQANQRIAQLASLVTNLCDMAELTAHELPLRPQAVDLAVFVQEVLQRCGERFDLDDTMFTFAEKQSITGMWDEARLGQALMNVLHNASKYGSGEPVEVELGRRDGHAYISVRDHGDGIAAEAQEHIFERFGRGSRSDGMGLGLYVSRHLLEALGGSISVHSKVGDGATFLIELPLEHAA